MSLIKKLKPNRYGWVPIATGLVISSLFVPVMKQFYSFNTIAVMQAIALFTLAMMFFVLLIKTQNLNFLVTIFMFLFLGIAVLTHHSGQQPGFSAALILAIGFIIWDIILLSLKKFKWRYREILELAVSPVNTVTNGYTSRPHPIGKLDYNKWEVRAFSRFVLRNLIAIPREERKRTVFIITWKIKYLFGGDYSQNTWIAFNDDGEISVTMAKGDYLNFQNEFSFDQLCKNLGDLFIEFFTLFKEGRHETIINKLDAVRENPFL